MGEKKNGRLKKEQTKQQSLKCECVKTVFGWLVIKCANIRVQISLHFNLSGCCISQNNYFGSTQLVNIVNILSGL